jgi:hypothetical protein
MGLRELAVNWITKARLRFEEASMVVRSPMVQPRLKEVPMVAHDASGPWGQPLGPMEIFAVWRITGGPTGPVITEIQQLLSSSSSPPSSSP